MRIYHFCRTKTALIAFMAGYRHYPVTVLRRLNKRQLQAMMYEVIDEHEQRQDKAVLQSITEVGL